MSNYSWDASDFAEEFKASNLQMVAVTGTADYSWDVYLLCENDGNLWYVSDGGCSCNEPLDNISFPDGWRRLDTVQQLVDLEREHGPCVADSEFWAKGREFFRGKAK